MKQKIMPIVLCIMLAIAGLTGSGAQWNKVYAGISQSGLQKKNRRKNQTEEKKEEKDSNYYKELEVDKDGTYDTKDEVCAYLVQYQCQPSNYMTKKDARKNGWEGGALNLVIEGKCIGGDYFGNYEEVLPVKEDREYHECDIDTINSSKRGAKRIIYSGDDDAGDWNIYYTDDHYETFTLLYGDDDYDE